MMWTCGRHSGRIQKYYLFVKQIKTISGVDTRIQLNGLRNNVTTTSMAKLITFFLTFGHTISYHRQFANVFLKRNKRKIRFIFIKPSETQQINGRNQLPECGTPTSATTNRIWSNKWIPYQRHTWNSHANRSVIYLRVFVLSCHALLASATDDNKAKNISKLKYIVGLASIKSFDVIWHFARNKTELANMLCWVRRVCGALCGPHWTRRGYRIDLILFGWSFSGHCFVCCGCWWSCHMPYGIVSFTQMAMCWRFALLLHAHSAHVYGSSAFTQIFRVIYATFSVIFHHQINCSTQLNVSVASIA